MDEKKAYRVEEGTAGCKECSHGTMWDIIDPFDCALSTSWGDKEFADDLCELLNDAYEAGLEKGKEQAVSA